jgi:hypothetical protein
MAMIPGIDVSTWDGDPGHTRTLDWSAYTWPFTFVKASEGMTADPLFAKQWAAARGHTLRGAYHFFRPKVDPKESALHLVGLLGDDLGELPAVLDIEVLDGLSNILDRAKTWLAWFEARTGVRPILYSRTSFLQDELHCDRYPYLASYKLWLASYPFDKLEPLSARQALIEDILAGRHPILFPPPPKPFSRVSFYQWTALGTPAMVPGYYTGADGKQEIDLNFYQGSLQDLQSEFGVDSLPYTPGEQPMSYLFSITPTNTTGSKVRPEPDTGSTPLTISLPYGKYAYGNKKIMITQDKFEVVNGVNTKVNQVGDIWLEVLAVDGTLLEVPAYIAEIHLGSRFAQITQLGTPPTPPPAGTLPELPVTVVLGDDVTYIKQTINVTLKPKAAG